MTIVKERKEKENVKKRHFLWFLVQKLLLLLQLILVVKDVDDVTGFLHFVDVVMFELIGQQL